MSSKAAANVLGLGQTVVPDPMTEGVQPNQHIGQGLELDNQSSWLTLQTSLGTPLGSMIAKGLSPDILESSLVRDLGSKLALRIQKSFSSISLSGWYQNLGGPTVLPST